MDKLGRNYHLSVQVPRTSNFIEIELPFTIEFDIQRNNLASSSVASIRIYNLNEDTRNKIRKDQMDYGVLQSIRLKAGYGSDLYTIFEGNTQQVWSVREGTNMVTQIQSFDGGFAFVNSDFNNTFPAGTSRQDMIAKAAGSLKGAGLEIGAIGNYPGAIAKGNSYSGPTMEILNTMTGGGTFVDNNKIFCLGDSEYVQGTLETINSDTGLLGTPVREQTFLNFSMIFEPRLRICQKVKLESSTGKNYNGEYRVISLQHKGMISPSVCGDLTTSVGVAYGLEQLKKVSER